MTSQPLFIFAALVAILTIAPLIPAVLLFLFLPNRAMVAGPFKGFKIDLSGSIAAYFVIFITLISIPRNWINEDIYEKQTISGTIVFPNDEIGAIDPRKISISINPASFRMSSVIDNNSITWWLDVLKPVEAEGSWPIEGVIIGYPSYASKMISVHSGQHDINTKNYVLPDVQISRPEIGDATHTEAILVR